MTSTLQQFLKELYALDPSLRAQEKQLLPIIEKLISHDPAQAPTKEFVTRLRSELKEHAAGLSETRASPRGLWQFVTGVAVTAVLLPVGFLAWQNGTQAPLTPLGHNVMQSGNRAFGSLEGIGREQDGKPESGGGGGVGGGGGGMTNFAVGEDAKMMIYPMTRYTYVYEGDIEGLSSSVDVYRRSPKKSSLNFSEIANSFRMGGADIDSFSGMKVSSITLAQDKPFGYQIYLNMFDSSIGIDAQWEQWPQSTCSTEDCFQRERLTAEQVPADDVLIGIAKDFASAHGIDLGAYGQPVVNENWKREYERMADKTMAYIPDVQSVVFPFMIDGKPAHDQSGAKTGITMGVNVKHKKVMSVWNIVDRSYEKSSYEGVSDAGDITNYLAELHRYPDMPVDENQKEVTVVLGTPEVGVATYHRYENNKSEELLVPSLIFPVQETRGDTEEGEWLYVTRIVVPLAKDLLKRSGMPDVMPMMDLPAPEVRTQE